MADYTLDDVLAGKDFVDDEADQPEEKPTAEPEVAEKPEQEAKEEPETKAEAPTAGAEDENKEWTKAMALDERRKRQELERKVREYEERAKQADEPKVDLFENPEKWQQTMLSKATHEIQMAKLEMSQELMRSLHKDYDQMEAEFIEMASTNPAVLAEFQKAANPARFAYETAQKAREAAQLKDIDGYKEKLRAEVEAEIRAKIEAEVLGKAQSQAKRDKALTPSLATARASGSDDDFVEPSLDDILKR